MLRGLLLRQQPGEHLRRHQGHHLAVRVRDGAQRPLVEFLQAADALLCDGLERRLQRHSCAQAADDGPRYVGLSDGAAAVPGLGDAHGQVGGGHGVGADQLGRGVSLQQLQRLPQMRSELRRA